ncbi:MAG: adenylyltransferase/cytidyltransferase family protein [Planctomycetes bacterium]|nr:adenylyltransferase/cytidyltransferase family protein [Planctomycetota bacterium]
MDYGKILTLNEFVTIRETQDLGQIVATSGGFDPIHPGHASCLIESKKLGETLIVIVNGDGFLRNKKGRAFQDLETRCFIVSCVRGVDFVVGYETNTDMTVIEPLRAIKPHIFTKGGDRTDISNVPEYHICQEMGTKFVAGVGLPKKWSSSDSLKDWAQFTINRRVIVTNLPEDTETDELMKIFSEYGSVTNVELRNLADSLIGFVTMHNIELAKEAAINLSLYELRGNIISTVVET